MRFNKLTLLGLLLLPSSCGMPFVPLMSTAEEISSLLSTLEDTSLELQRARAELNINREDKRQALGNMLPALSLSGSWGVEETDFNGRSSTSHPTNYGVNVEQPIFTGGQLKKTYDAKKLAYKAQQAYYDAFYDATVVNVVSAYVNILAAEEAITAQTNLKEALQKDVKAAQIRFDIGGATKTDISLAQARLAEANAGLLNAKNQLSVAQESLKRLIGYYPESALSWPVDPLNGELEEQRFNDQLQTALVNHPSIVSAYLSLQAAEEGVPIARAAFLPHVNMQARYNKQENLSPTFGGGALDVQSVTVNASLPLYQGGKRGSAVRSAKAQRIAAQSDYDDTIRATRQAAISAYARYTASFAQVKAYNRAIEANELALSGIVREQELGQRTALDVLNAKQDLLNANLNYAQARADHISAAYQLLAALGRL